MEEKNSLRDPFHDKNRGRKIDCESSPGPFSVKNCNSTEAYPEASQTSKIELFVKAICPVCDVKTSNRAFRRWVTNWQLWSSFLLQWLEITGNLFTYLSPILLQNEQKPITNRNYRNNFRSELILILSKIEFKTLKKKPGDETFRVSFKFPRRGGDQRLADFNKHSNTETRSC